ALFDEKPLSKDCGKYPPCGHEQREAHEKEGMTMRARIEPSGAQCDHQSGPIRRKTAIRALVCALSSCCVVASSATADPVSLLLPQSIAFSILGHSCGGIQERAYATGFDPASGYPIGDVYIQTRCGGSGRGGGYRTTTYSAWVGVTWDFSGNVLSASPLATSPTVSSTFTETDASGNQLSNTETAAYLTVPAPGAPIVVTAVQTGDQFEVAWTPAPLIPAVITSSTLTATPVDLTTPILSATVSGGTATGLIGPLQPQTTYQITVVSTTIGGSSPPSDPITVTTVVASVV